ncbi:MAG: CDP-alcohol phosphatidyltransferase family protein, partial [Planctomycetota bacterium]|nr:CDP-alcohol phosphatidyltransferase family protein [Planctomycetota bacterium]
FELAICGLMLAGLFDFLDGPVARWLGVDEIQERFGSQLDMVADMSNFGLAPVVVLATAGGFSSVPEWILLFVFLLAVAFRLAYFGTFGLELGEVGPFYTGLPCTFVALFLPLVVAGTIPLGEKVQSWVLRGLVATLALAMVTPIRVPKPRGVWLLLFPLAALGMTAFFVGRALGWAD